MSGLSHGYQRIGLTQHSDTGLTEQITTLAAECARLEPALTDLASEVREVAETLLPPPPDTHT